MNRFGGLVWALFVIAFVAAGCSSPAPVPNPIPTEPPTVTSAEPPISTQLLVTTPAVVPASTPTAEPTSTPTAPPIIVPTIPSVVVPPSPVPFATATPVPTNPVATPIVVGQYGGTLNIMSRENIAHLDVHQEVSPALSTWGPGIAYSRLLRFKSGPDVELPSLALECELCESWTMDDSRTYTFKLRDDVLWQSVPPSQGRPLVSSDVLFSYNRQREPGMPNAPLLRSIARLDAPEPDLLRISLVAADADFLVALADGHSKIVMPEVVRLSGDLRTGPTIGTGPWTLMSTDRDVSHRFEKNPAYFEQQYPFADNLIVHIVTDRVTRDAAFRVQVVDVQQMDPKEWIEFEQQIPDAPLLVVPQPGNGLEVALNTTIRPFDDIRVRQAAFFAMDPWKTIEDVWLGFAFVSTGIPVQDARWLLGPDDLRDYFGDPQRAEELLRESGISLPIPLTIKVGDFGPSQIEHARRMAEEMEAVGFQATIEIVNRRSFVEDVWLRGDYAMFAGPPAPVTAPNGYMLPVLHSGGPWNTAGYRDAELDRLIEAQSTEFDVTARGVLVRGIQQLVMENAYRFMPAATASIWTWWPRVRNFYPNFAGGEYAHWSKVWIRP